MPTESVNSENAAASASLTLRVILKPSPALQGTRGANQGEGILAFGQEPHRLIGELAFPISCG